MTIPHGKRHAVLLQLPFKKNCGQDHLCEGDLNVNLSFSGWVLAPAVSRHSSFWVSYQQDEKCLCSPLAGVITEKWLQCYQLIAHEFPVSCPCPCPWSNSKPFPVESLSSAVLPPSACRPWWWEALWNSTWQWLCGMRVRIPTELWSTSTTQQGCPIDEC